jgi:type II secretory pathway component PulF
MRLPQHPPHDYLKHFAKDNAKTRILALALLMTPTILLAVAVIVGIVLNK